MKDRSYRTILNTILAAVCAYRFLRYVGISCLIGILFTAFLGMQSPRSGVDFVRRGIPFVFTHEMFERGSTFYVFPFLTNVLVFALPFACVLFVFHQIFHRFLPKARMPDVWKKIIVYSLIMGVLLVTSPLFFARNTAYREVYNSEPYACKIGDLAITFSFQNPLIQTVFPFFWWHWEEKEPYTLAIAANINQQGVEATIHSAILQAHTFTNFAALPPDTHIPLFTSQHTVEQRSDVFMQYLTSPIIIPADTAIDTRIHGEFEVTITTEHTQTRADCTTLFIHRIYQKNVRRWHWAWGRLSFPSPPWYVSFIQEQEQ